MVRPPQIEEEARRCCLSVMTGLKTITTVYLMDQNGARLEARRLPEGLTGVGRLHDMIAAHADEPNEAIVGIEKDHGLWVSALAAAGIRCMRSIRWRLPCTGVRTPRLGREIRWRRCEVVSRPGTHRPAQPSSTGRRQ